MLRVVRWAKRAASSALVAVRSWLMGDPMAKKKPKNWPPADGRDFVQGAEFGEILVAVVRDYEKQYPSMDFTDAVAQLFEWFSGRLAEEPDFFSAKVPTWGRFLAYLRQTVWNAGRLAARRRKRHLDVEALPVNRAIVAEEPSAEELAELHERTDQLTEPHKTVFEKLFFEEEDAQMVADTYDMTVDQVYQLYDEAVG